MRERGFPTVAMILAASVVARAAGAAAADGPPSADSTAADSLRAAAAPDSTPADLPNGVGVTAVMDTLRIVEPLPAPPEIPELRDPRDEPLFVRYAPPSRLMGLGDRLNLDRVRWRYAPPESVRAEAAPADSGPPAE